jgi:putative metallopeptidase DUF4344
MRFLRGLASLPLLAALFAGCSAPTQDVAKGHFEYAVKIEASFVQDRRNQSLVGASTLPDATDFLNENLKLPLDIPVEYVRCGQANAYWSPENQTIRICHQLGAFLLPQVRGHLASAAQGEYASEEDFEADVLTITLNAVRFVYFHEVGHALIQLYNLPITGREEDVADQFATWMLLRDHRPNQGRLPYNMTAGETAALSGAVGFLAFARAASVSNVGVLDWAQTHSFDLARSYNIVCWTYGSNPRKFSWLTPVPSQAERLNVPANREPWCNYEWNRIDYAFTTLLADHLK